MGTPTEVPVPRKVNVRAAPPMPLPHLAACRFAQAHGPYCTKESDPGGVKAISRWLSEATPPVAGAKVAPTLEGSQRLANGRKRGPATAGQAGGEERPC